MNDVSDEQQKGKKAFSTLQLCHITFRQAIAYTNHLLFIAFIYKYEVIRPSYECVLSLLSDRLVTLDYRHAERRTVSHSRSYRICFRTLGTWMCV